MIYIDKNEDTIKVEGKGIELMAEMCSVLLAISEECDIDPEALVDELREMFLAGVRRKREEEEAEEDEVSEELHAILGKILEDIIGYSGEEEKKDVKDKRSKETVQGTGRRARRRLH